jgi:hypothetical protein
MPLPRGGSASHTVLSASLSWTTTPIAANTSTPRPSKVSSRPSVGREAAASIDSTACAPVVPRRPAICADTSPRTAAWPNTSPAIEMVMTSSGPSEKTE